MKIACLQYGDVCYIFNKDTLEINTDAVVNLDYDATDDDHKVLLANSDDRYIFHYNEDVAYFKNSVLTADPHTLKELICKEKEVALSKIDKYDELLNEFSPVEMYGGKIIELHNITGIKQYLYVNAIEKDKPGMIKANGTLISYTANDKEPSVMNKGNITCVIKLDDIIGIVSKDQLRYEMQNWINKLIESI